MFHYPIKLSILALQLPLTSMTASHNLCHHLYTLSLNVLTVSSVGIKINYHLLTSIYVTSILSYTVLEDDTNDEK
ncbi:XXYS1_4_G0023160.mRNA.1.CDS.1 [Saccharomyces cerevisiae]|nr:XXYS1_4_G0023160.mRNA.1.CDS.1 [Saccharomyces cerevisiae]